MSKNNFSLKQTISPIISILLLVSITVIISLGMYNFLTNYVQDTQRTVENNTILDSLQIRSILSDSEQSIIQTPFEQINISEVIYEGVECTNNSGVVSGKPLRVNMSSCAQASGQSSGTLTIETNEGVIQQQIRIEDTTSSTTNSSTSSVDCSSIPGDWVEVPGNSYFGTSDFCVMQFEAKDVSGVATSQPSSTPWVNINFTDARSACTDLNSEHSSLDGTFKMITNREWMTIARDAEQQDENWDSSTVGSGSMYRGHSDDNPNNALSVSNTGDYYDGTGNLAPSTERRVLELSNGEIIWDLGGNVWGMG